MSRFISKDLPAPEQMKSEWIQQMARSPSLTEYATNVRVQLQEAHLENYVVPYFAVNDLSRDAYICSNITGFIHYARDELKLVPSRTARWGTHLILIPSYWLLRLARINRAVFVNNFLFSTNLYPKEGFSDETIREWTRHLMERYPEHVIFWRSLTDFSHQSLLDRFKSHGYGLIPSRQIYVLDSKKSPYLNRRDVIRDRALLNKTSLIQVQNDEIQESDYARIAELYRQLYVEKHSVYNPQYTPEFMRSGHQAGVLQFFGLRNEHGELEAVVGYWERDDVFATPILGYNTAIPQKVGLYRMLSAHMASEAVRREKPLHYSSGASDFKRSRGALDFIEYSAVRYSHLKSPFRKFVWRLLERSANAIAIKLFKEYKL